VSHTASHINQYQPTAAFDAAAASYDAEFSFSQTGMLQRKRVHYFLQNRVAALTGKQILELNCGTGEDAIWMAATGCRVTATDLSANMIDMVQKKAAAQPQLTIKAMQCGFDEVAAKLSGNQFDFVLSNFGGLNCISNDALEKFSVQLHNITKAGSTVALVIMSNKCWWEKWYFWLKGQKQAMYRRQQAAPLAVQVHGSKQLVWYYHPAEVEKACSKAFIKLYTRPVGLFLPPSYMEGYFKKKKGLLMLLYGLEKIFGNFSFLSAYADHYLIVLKRKDTI
jgi:ubiquinone/menaquinone biosynthesis C-methylase UbiE